MPAGGRGTGAGPALPRPTPTPARSPGGARAAASRGATGSAANRLHAPAALGGGREGHGSDGAAAGRGGRCGRGIARVGGAEVRLEGAGGPLHAEGGVAVRSSEAAAFQGLLRPKGSPGRTRGSEVCASGESSSGYRLLRAGWVP